MALIARPSRSVGPALAWLAGAAIGVGALVVLRRFGPVSNLWWLSMLAIAVVLLLHDRWRAFGPKGRAVAGGALAAAAAVVALRVARFAYGRALDPPEWDFAAFWLAARVAMAGRDFYDPAAFRALIGPLRPSAEFVAEIVDVGYWYPPPSILLVAPFGALDYGVAGMVWVGCVAAALLAAVIALWRAFLADAGAAGLAIAALVLCVEQGTRATLHLAQTNFLLLLWLILLWHHRERRVAGVWLALAILTKPIAAALIGYALARRRWSMLGVSALALAAATVATVAAFGWAPTASYLASNPVERLPDYVYSQSWNQSVAGVVMRGLGSTRGPARALAFGLSALVMAATLWRAFGRRADDGLCFGLLLVGGLLAYPGSLAHYSVLLVLPIILLWSRRAILPGGMPLVLGVAAAAYASTAASRSGAFVAAVLTWIVLLAVAAPAGKERAHAVDARKPVTRPDAA